jgi:hypothetical protein
VRLSANCALEVGNFLIRLGYGKNDRTCRSMMAVEAHLGGNAHVWG